MDASVEVQIEGCGHQMCCECATAICCLEVSCHTMPLNHAMLELANGQSVLAGPRTTMSILQRTNERRGSDKSMKIIQERH